MCGPMKIPKLTSAPENQTWNLMIARLTLYFTTTDTTRPFTRILHDSCFEKKGLKYMYDCTVHAGGPGSKLFEIVKISEFPSQNIVAFPNKAWILRVCNICLLKTLQLSISPFPTLFSTHSEIFLPFSSKLKLSANSFTLEESKI